MLKNELALKDPALLYKMLLDEKAKQEVKCVSETAKNFMNAVRESLDEYIDIYQEDYGTNWQEAFENDWDSLYYEILEKCKIKLLEYFRSII